MRIGDDTVRQTLSCAKAVLDALGSNAIVFASGDNVFEVVETIGDIRYPRLEIGDSISEFGVVTQVLVTGEPASGQLDDPDPATNTRMVVYPVVSSKEPSRVIGTWGFVFRQRWPEVEAFDTYTNLMGSEFPQGCMVYISDRDKFIRRYESDNYELGGHSIAQVGDRLSRGGVALKAMEQNAKLTAVLPVEVYNTPVKVAAIPINDRQTGMVVGAVGIAINRGMATQLQNIIGDTATSMQEINSAITSVANSAEQTATNSRKLDENIQNLVRIIQTIDEILINVKNIADQTKMLGLNAAIEAARAGESGRGFAVVADEVRKLSEESKGTVVEIKRFLGEISNTLKEVKSQAEEGMISSQEQAAAIEEITASLQELTALMQSLDTMAARL
ncbi:MAG: hypothetical protein GXX09_05855 [Syntrophomonadaceae bacterium]|nr:hypothetical protein [Syntrophomonadaceae bacterium]